MEHARIRPLDTGGTFAFSPIRSARTLAVKRCHASDLGGRGHDWGARVFAQLQLAFVCATGLHFPASVRQGRVGSCASVFARLNRALNCFARAFLYFGRVRTATGSQYCALRSSSERDRVSGFVLAPVGISDSFALGVRRCRTFLLTEGAHFSVGAVQSAIGSRFFTGATGCDIRPLCSWDR
jgi:hypothetical protein